VATLNEDRHALAGIVRDRNREFRSKLESVKSLGSKKKRKQATRLTCATADPNCCHLACTAQALLATKLPAPSQARAVGPAELTVRRRCPKGSRRTGVARRNEDRETLAWFAREDARTDQARIGSINRLGMNEIGNRPLA
jgi:hypothetical protein